MSEVVVKKRDTAIDFVKAIATILVINSHMAICYPNHEYLATGGSIGDVLFFFASGYALFLGRKMNFVNWYKRRLGRIIATIIAMGLIACLVFRSNESFLDIMLARRYWFLQCIIVLYIFFYPVISAPRRMKYMFPTSLLLVLILYIYRYGAADHGIFYGKDNIFRWILYFPVMLAGGWICLNANKLRYRWYSLPMLILCVICWYMTIVFFGRSDYLIVSYLPFLGIPVFAYMLGKSPRIIKLYDVPVVGNLLFILGSICLESYLVQYFVFTDKLNHIFPWNVPMIIIAVLVGAYILHVLASLLMQIFDSKPFDWRSLFIYRK